MKGCRMELADANGGAKRAANRYIIGHCAIVYLFLLFCEYSKYVIMGQHLHSLMFSNTYKQ